MVLMSAGSWRLRVYWQWNFRGPRYSSLERRHNHSWKASQVPDCCWHRGINQLLLLPFCSAAPSPPNSKHRLFQNQKLGKKVILFSSIAWKWHSWIWHAHANQLRKTQLLPILNYCFCMNVDANTTTNRKHNLCGLIAKMQARDIDVLNSYCLWAP